MSYIEAHRSFEKIVESGKLPPLESWPSFVIPSQVLELAALAFNRANSAGILNSEREAQSNLILSYWYQVVKDLSPTSQKPTVERDGRVWVRRPDGDFSFDYMEIEGPTDVKVLTILRVDDRFAKDVFTITRRQEDDQLDEFGHPVTLEREVYDADGDLVKRFKVVFRGGKISQFNCIEEFISSTDSSLPAMRKETNYTFQ